MKTLSRIFTNIKLAFTRTGLVFVASRIPSMVFWATVSTGLLIGGQFLYFTMLPANYFFTYDSPAHINSVTLGETPILEYCRNSKGDYPIAVDAQLKRIEPPVYTQQYEVDTNLPAGKGCITREVGKRPTAPGDYKIDYTVRATLPFGIEKTTRFYSDTFTVRVPTTLYGDYQLTINEVDDQKDGVIYYQAGQNLQYSFTADTLVEYFGTTQRYLVCNGKEYFIDSYSGRNTAGLKDSTNNTTNIPAGVRGSCHLELRIMGTVGDKGDTVEQVLKSNIFVVQ